ncbi:Alkaline phosphatase, tissue-nonspecific isozyme, partial [Fragariocoptes setiger]
CHMSLPISISSIHAQYGKISNSMLSKGLDKIWRQALEHKFKNLLRYSRHEKNQYEHVQSSRNDVRPSPATTRLVTYCVIVLTLVSQNYVEALQSQAAGPPESMFTVYKHSTSEMNTEYWLKQGRQSLERALKYQPIVNQAKNGILFIGDGMSLSTITAARILFGQQHNRSGEESALSFEQLPNVALLKTYNVDQQIPDSAATATALLSGVKTNFYTLGVNAHVRLNDTNCTSHTAHAVHSILKLAQDAGKSTGIVTNTRITHATPGAAFAHSSNRKWECDHYMPTNLGPECKDIARQLIEDKPGINLNVILGGGRRCFFGVSNKDPTEGRGYRRDDRNLIDLWVKQKRAANRFNYAFVNSTRDLRSIDPTRTDYLLGLFAYSHMAYEEMRDQSDDGEPSLAEMTETAIRILSRNPRGYVLLVEGGRIDHAHHENIAGVALRETIALSQAVQVARYLTNPLETLLAVTSDHAHALTINGLAPRGNSILGLSRFFENSSQIPYTTLLYGNGPGNQQPRRDPSLEPNSTETPFYVQHAAVHQEESFHDGGDVAGRAGANICSARVCFCHVHRRLRKRSPLSQQQQQSHHIAQHSNGFFDCAT